VGRLSFALRSVLPAALLLLMGGACGGRNDGAATTDVPACGASLEWRVAWARQFSDVQVSSMAVGARDQLLIALSGSQGDVDIGGGPLGPFALLSLDANGDVLWAKGIPAETTVIAWTRAGDIIAGGRFSETLQLGSTTLTSPQHPSLFILKLDPKGEVSWLRSLDPGAQDRTSTVMVDARTVRLVEDASGEILLLGDISLMPQGGQNPPSFEKLFLAKAGADGDLLWTHVFGDTSVVSTDLAVDDQGGAFVAAHINQGTVDFGGGPLVPVGGPDIVLAKLDSAGQHVWSHAYGGSGNELPTSMALDANGEIMLAGMFLEGLDLAGVSLQNRATEDVFLARFDGNGSPLWSFSPSSGQTNGDPKVSLDGCGHTLMGLGVGSATNAMGAPRLTWIDFDAKGKELSRLAASGTDYQFFAAQAFGTPHDLVVTGEFRGSLSVAGQSWSSHAVDRSAFVMKLMR
jgi:hypothetical protein